MRERAFRADLEGLRGLAVALVVLFHAHLGVPGGFVGVDAFYVLSGYLITELLLREVARTGRLDLAAFYVRRARRILPAATAAIVASLAFAAIVVAPLDLPTVALDATAAGLFVSNIVFALRATDYFAPSTPSPFLHYWSLGTEEQFYLLWPVLLLVGVRVRRVGPVIVALCAASLALAIALGVVAPVWAFYSLPARAWQLALGAIVAVYGPSATRLPSRLMAPAGWLGVAILGAAAVASDPSVAGFGLGAIGPAVGVALVICAGRHAGGPGLVLSFAPLRWLGRISFSLYLYHWPVLVLGSIVAGEPGVEARWAMVGLSVAFGAASWRLVEQPFRHGGGAMRAPWRSLALAGATVVAVVVTAQVVGATGASALAASNEPGAAPIAMHRPTVDLRGTDGGPVPEQAASTPAATTTATPRPTATSRELRPRIADARADGDGLNERGCGLSLAGKVPPRCDLGVPDGTVTVALVGDSHAAQWFPALDAIARARGWRIVPFTKDSCIFVDTRIVSLHLEREYTECAAWRANVVAALGRIKPDLVVVSSSRWVHPVDPADAAPQRQAEAMARLVAKIASRVAIIADTPLAAQDVPACLSRRDRTVESCATATGYALTAHLARDGRAATALGATLIDPSSWLCSPDVCPAVIDRTIAYRDDHHLTATMARALAPLLEARLLEALSSPAP